MSRKFPGKGRPRKHRVDFRPNRSKPARQKGWNLSPEETVETDLATPTSENVQAKGAISRKRTVVEPQATQAGEQAPREGTATAVRGAFVEVDDGQNVWLCSIRRVLRTRVIRGRSPVVVGDRVNFLPSHPERPDNYEGTIHHVKPRRTTLTRSDGRRTHVIAANVDQAIVVSSVREPTLKPHLLDRYLVAAHAGDLAAAICINKVDLDDEDEAAEVVDRYRRLGYPAIVTSAATGVGIDALRQLLAGKISLLAGQSGVGKSSLLNAVQPGLNLKTAEVSTSTEKGKHTTTTSVWLKLDVGGAVIDTPGIRALDVAMVPLQELEMHFIEFTERLQHCRFPNCVHIHEDGCAVKAAVGNGDIDPSRYESYLELFFDLSEVRSNNERGTR